MFPLRDPGFFGRSLLAVVSKGLFICWLVMVSPICKNYMKAAELVPRPDLSDPGTPTPADPRDRRSVPQTRGKTFGHEC